MSRINGAPEGVPGGFNLPSINSIIALTAERFPRLALAGTVGILAVGGHAILTPKDPSGLTVLPAEAHSQKHQDQKDKPKPAEHKTEKHHPRTDCATFRISANDIYAGSGCGKEGATAEIVGDGHPEKGWVYSAIVTGGVKKCFFIKQGGLPQPDKPDPNHVAVCAGMYGELAQNKYRYLKSFNCKFLPSGLQSCRSGTPYTGIVSTCRRNVVFRNYATAEPSPWNADGKAPAGFSDEVSNSQGRRAVSYRVKIKDKPRNGHPAGAAVIRGVLKRHGWGLMYPNCPNPKQLRGGTSSIAG